MKSMRDGHVVTKELFRTGLPQDRVVGAGRRDGEDPEALAPQWRAGNRGAERELSDRERRQWRHGKHEHSIVAKIELSRSFQAEVIYM